MSGNQGNGSGQAANGGLLTQGLLHAATRIPVRVLSPLTGGVGSAAIATGPRLQNPDFDRSSIVRAMARPRLW